MEEDEETRKIKELLAQQGIDLAIQENKNRFLREEIDDWKKQTISIAGGQSSDIEIIYKKKMREIEERIAQENKVLEKKQADDLNNLILGEAQEKNPVPEQDSPVLKEEPEPDIKPTGLYKDLVLSLKKDREDFFRDHFDEMASIARNPDTPQEEIDYVIDRNKNYLMIMAISHYHQLLEHPENPYYQQSMNQLKKEIADEKNQQEKAEKEKEERRLQQQKEEQERKKKIFAVLRDQITQSQSEGQETRR